MGKKQVKKRKPTFLLLVFIVTNLFSLAACWTPPYAYLEVKKMGITVNENCLYFLAGLGSTKIHNSDFPASLAIFKYPLVSQAGKATQTSGWGAIDIKNFKESLVFSVLLENMLYYRGEPWTSDLLAREDVIDLLAYHNVTGRGEDYNGGEPRLYNLLAYTDAYDLMTAPGADRRLVSVKIGFERAGDMYYIKKIGDYRYDDDSALREGLVRGVGFFEEGAEYLIVFYPYLNHHFSPPAIPPVRFTMINGVPVIWLEDK
jgi:hypothetical protein